MFGRNERGMCTRQSERQMKTNCVTNPLNKVKASTNKHLDSHLRLKGAYFSLLISSADVSPNAKTGRSPVMDRYTLLDGKNHVAPLQAVSTPVKEGFPPLSPQVKTILREVEGREYFQRINIIVYLRSYVYSYFIPEATNIQSQNKTFVTKTETVCKNYTITNEKQEIPMHVVEISTFGFKSKLGPT